MSIFLIFSNFVLIDPVCLVVGSAAYNLLMISALCISAINAPETRRIKLYSVFMVKKNKTKQNKYVIQIFLSIGYIIFRVFCLYMDVYRSFDNIQRCCWSLGSSHHFSDVSLGCYISFSRKMNSSLFSSTTKLFVFD